MPKEKPAAPEAAPQRRGMFASVATVVEATGLGDINNLEIGLGDNKFRVISEPILIRKHWDLPSSAKGTAIPCAKFITDLNAYAADPEGYLASLADCPYCKLAAEHPGYYGVKDHWIFNVVQDGVVKIAEFSQRSIIKQLMNFENDKDWVELMPNGLVDIELNLKKESTGPKPQNIKYTLGGVPTSKQLSPEQLNEYRGQMVDLVKLKAPPSLDGEGKAKWDEWLADAGVPKEGDKPKKLA